MSANQQKCKQIIKNVSKSSLAVIILSLLLILSMIVGMTAAWFVGSDHGTDSGTGTNVIFGKLGSATITVEGVKWTNAKGVTVVTTGEPVSTGDLKDQREVRGYYMPGDTLIGASVTVKYDQTGTEDKVYYIVARKNKGADSYSEYYVINNGKFVNPVVIGEDKNTINVGVLDSKDSEATFTAKGGIITVTGKTSGSKAVEVTRDNAKDINNDYQGQSVSYDTTAGVGFSMNGSDYELRVIQSTNLTDGQAYQALTTGWNDKGAIDIKLG